MDKIKTVALVEDHELMRQALEASLAPYPDIDCVGSAPNAQMGLDLLLAYKPDVALIDIILPDKNGIELVRDYLNYVPEKKIIFLTSSEDEDSILAAFKAGASGYCTKQSSAAGIDWLVQAIKRVYEGEIWIDPRIAQYILNLAINWGNLGNPVIIEGESESHYAKCLEENPLTEREMQVLSLIVNGNDNAKIAEALFITVGTVKTHVRNILDKLSCDDRTQAAVRALRLGLVS